jgi:hypothetical protein
MSSSGVATGCSVTTGRRSEMMACEGMQYRIRTHRDVLAVIERDV